ncbi:MAG TPA: hypothetical protein VFE46_12960 [Pirellulales bacterium]|jgi:hypothetical protein|nr:hypothetical protein [Pirellulales bacterium]
MLPTTQTPTIGVELFFGPAHPAEARVYAVVTTEEHELANFRLHGHLVGPDCEFSQTLTARIPFVMGNSHNVLMAESVIPDPCFWTPELPFLYRAELQIARGESLLALPSKLVGIRRLGIRSGQLFFEGKRFVLRGVHEKVIEAKLSNSEISFARQSWTAAVIPWPDSALCDLASRLGVLLVADLRTAETDANCSAVVETLHSLASWPAVIMAIVDAETIANIKGQGAIRNLLFAQYFVTNEPFQLHPKAHVVFAEVSLPVDFAQRAKACNRPVIAVRRLPHPVKIELARSACDALQRDLAPFGDFAGYIV